MNDEEFINRQKEQMKQISKLYDLSEPIPENFNKWERALADFVRSGKAEEFADKYDRNKPYKNC